MCRMYLERVSGMVKSLVVVGNSVSKGVLELLFQRDAYTRAQIKSRAQLSEMYAEVSTPELSNVIRLSR